MRPATAIVLLALGPPLASAQGRNPDIGVAVQSAQGLDEAKADVLEALRRQKPDSILTSAEAKSSGDLVLTLVRRYTSTPGNYGVGGATSDVRRLQCTVDGLVGDRLVPHPEMHLSHGVRGTGASWSLAAATLVDMVAEYAESRQHELLRKRMDWPDFGFEFEPLTKERKKQFGTRDGEVVVTVVYPTGLADKAGLQPGDALLALGDKKLKAPAELARFLYTAAPGTEVALQVAHAGARRKVTLAAP